MDVTITYLRSKGRRFKGIQRHGRTERGRLFIRPDDETELKSPCMAVLERDGAEPMVLHGAHLALDEHHAGGILLRGYEFVLGKLADRHAVVQEWRIENIDLGEVMKSAKRCWEMEAQLREINEARAKAEGYGSPRRAPETAA
jgi:hypothetical protein